MAAPSSFLVELERAHEMPRDRFSFAVFVGCENDAVCFLCERASNCPPPARLFWGSHRSAQNRVQRRCRFCSLEGRECGRRMIRRQIALPTNLLMVFALVGDSTMMRSIYIEGVNCLYCIPAIRFFDDSSYNKEAQCAVDDSGFKFSHLHQFVNTRARRYLREGF